MPDVRETGLMVDAGATSYIITDISKFKEFDSTFQAGTHCVELADGSRCTGVAKNRGDVEVWLLDSRGRLFRTTLRSALYIPTYPQDIFSVKAATSNGATVTFSERKNVVLHKDGTKFPIYVHNEQKMTVMITVRKVSICKVGMKS